MVKRALRKQSRMEAPPGAQGSPVPLTGDEVAALVRGQMPAEHLARILEAKPVPVGPRGERPGKAKRGPVDLTGAELTALATGNAPEKVRSRLEKAAAAGRLKVVRRETSKPRLRPPGEAGGRHR